MSKKKKKKDTSTNYKKTPEYKALTPDEQKLADLYHGVTTKSSKYTTKQLKSALKKATKDSAPYMSGILRATQDQVSRDYANETGDYQSHLDTINENIKEINDDLARNKDYYSLEEQNALAKQARDYEKTRGELVQSLADSGTNFSSIGTGAKQYASDTNKGIVESTTATYNKQIADTQAQATSDLFKNTQAQKDYERTHQYNVQNIGSKAEQALGTSNLPSLPGYNQLGKIAGQYTENAILDINSRQQAYLDTAKQKSLTF